MMRRASLAVGALAVACLAACGSTVQYTGSALSDGSLGGQQLGTSATGSNGQVLSDGGTSSTGGSDGTSGGSDGVSGASGVSGGSGGGTSGTTGTDGTSGTSPGGTPTTSKSSPTSSKTKGTTGGVKAPVEIGVVEFPDVNAAAAEFGGSAQTGSQSNEVNTAIAYVNAHGGLAGHQIKSVVYNVSLTSTQSYDTEYQEACADFTQTYHVAAVVFIGGSDDNFANCLAKAGVLLLDHGHDLRSLQDFQNLPLLAAPDEVAGDRIARAMVSQMLSRGVVKSGDKLGLLEIQNTGEIETGNDITNLLKAHGVTTVLATVAPIASTPAIADAITSVQSDELKFAAEGVKTVTFMCPGCMSFFLDDAKSQNYYPRYVFTTLDGIIGFAGAGDAKELGNSLALSWSPIEDYGIYSHPTALQGNATYEKCRTIEKANATSDTSAGVAYFACGSYLELQAAANANQLNPLTGAAMAAGFLKLGHFPGVSNKTTDESPSHHDGTSSYQLMTYSSGCDCMNYASSKLYPFN